MNQFEVTADEGPPVVEPFWADATDRTAWKVEIPWAGEIFGYDRKLIAAWLRDAADRVENAPEHGDYDSPARHWDGKWHAECACGEVFSAESRAEANQGRTDHIKTAAGSVTV